MANLAAMIEEAAADQVIEAVIIGQSLSGESVIPRYDEQPRGTLLTWDEARPWLDYETTLLPRASCCNAVFVWTDKMVLFVQLYHGLSVTGVPRVPQVCEPEIM